MLGGQVRLEDPSAADADGHERGGRPVRAARRSAWSAAGSGRRGCAVPARAAPPWRPCAGSFCCHGRTHAKKKAAAARTRPRAGCGSAAAPWCPPCAAGTETYDSTTLASPREVVVPDVVEDLRLGQHPVGVAHEVAQQLELGGGQRDRLAGLPHLVAVVVEFDVGEGRAGGVGSRPSPPVRRSTARIRAITSSRLNGFVT